jgi:hypothetical protein
MEDVTVTALCDINIGKARALAEEHFDPDGITLCSDYMELFDMNIDVSEGKIKIDASTRGLDINMEELSGNGLFVEMKSALAGDASTGTIYAGSLEATPVAIASTTKLMTALVALKYGSPSQQITISENAAYPGADAQRLVLEPGGLLARQNHRYPEGWLPG